MKLFNCLVVATAILSAFTVTGKYSEALVKILYKILIYVICTFVYFANNQNVCTLDAADLIRKDRYIPLILNLKQFWEFSLPYTQMELENIALQIPSNYPIPYSFADTQVRAAL
jgi:hypothetical protein